MSLVHAPDPCGFSLTTNNRLSKQRLHRVAGHSSLHDTLLGTPRSPKCPFLISSGVYDMPEDNDKKKTPLQTSIFQALRRRHLISHCQGLTHDTQELTFTCPLPYLSLSLSFCQHLDALLALSRYRATPSSFLTVPQTQRCDVDHARKTHQP